MDDATPARGTPPNAKQLARELGDRLPLWNAIADMVGEFGATWRWVYSDAQAKWTFRSYLPGDRFFCSITPTADALEVSLNLTSEEWSALDGETAAEREALAAIKAKGDATGEDPAWIHVPARGQGDLPMLAKLLFARGRRIQPAREKKRKRR